MIPDWPASLPPPEIDGWTRRAQDVRRRSQPEAGPPRFRRRSSLVARSVSLVLTLDRNQLAVFDQFWEHDCAAGALLFRMPDPTTDGWELLASDGEPMLTGAGGDPLLLSAVWLCAWGDETPTETMVPDTHFRVSFGVWVLP